MQVCAAAAALRLACMPGLAVRPLLSPQPPACVASLVVAAPPGHPLRAGVRACSRGPERQPRLPLPSPAQEALLFVGELAQLRQQTLAQQQEARRRAGERAAAALCWGRHAETEAETVVQAAEAAVQAAEKQVACTAFLQRLLDDAQRPGGLCYGMEHVRDVLSSLWAGPCTEQQLDALVGRRQEQLCAFNAVESMADAVCAIQHSIVAGLAGRCLRRARSSSACRSCRAPRAPLRASCASLRAAS